MFPITKKSPKDVCRGGAYFSCHLVTLSPCHTTPSHLKKEQSSLKRNNRLV